jgi:RNA-directed DNA polymerase
LFDFLRKAAKWVKGCFDNIRHPWLQENVVIDKKALSQWLNAGYVENQRLFPTLEGTPQGGIITPRTHLITFSLL